MASQWYYAKGGSPHGPVMAQRLKELASSGELAPTDLVWKEGLSEWCAASTLKGLFPEVQAKPADQPSLPTVMPATQPSFPQSLVELDAVSLRPRSRSRSSPASPFARLVAGGVLLALVFVCGFLLGRKQSADSQPAEGLSPLSLAKVGPLSPAKGQQDPSVARRDLMKTARKFDGEFARVVEDVVDSVESGAAPWSVADERMFGGSSGSYRFSAETLAAYSRWRAAKVAKSGN